jgi:hypothetical protein
VILARVPGAVARPAPAPELPPLNAFTGHDYVPALLHPSAPGYADLGYKVVKLHHLPTKAACTADSSGQIPPALIDDPLGCQYVWAHPEVGGTWLSPGPNGWFKLTPKLSGGGDSGILSGFTSSLSNLATGAFGAFSLAVDFLHEATEQIKGAVAKVVVDVIAALPGSPCQSYPTECEAAAKAGLEIGLAAMGMPPSIPSWDELKEQGVEYLAAEIASQTGAPDVLTQHALEVAESAIEEITAQRGISAAPGYDWVEPYDGFDPAALLLGVRKSTAAPVLATAIVRQPTDVYQGGRLPLPIEFPESGVLPLPMVLPPNTASLYEPYCVADPFHHITCKPIFFLTQPICAYQHYVIPPGGGPAVPETVNFDCALSTWVQTYYRNQWVLQNWLPNGCTNLVATSVLDIGAGQQPWPLPPYFELARLHVAQAQDWMGPVFVAPGCP